MSTDTQLEVFFQNDNLPPVSLSDRFSDWIDMNFKKLRQLFSVPGNGIISERSVPVSSFVRLHLAVGGTIELIASEEEKVVIRTDDNLQQYVQAVNYGRTLYISASAKAQIPAFTQMHIQVYIRQLDTINIAHSGMDFRMPSVYKSDNPLDVKIQSDGNVYLNLVAPSMKLLSQTNGNVQLEGQCNQCVVKVQNNGNFDARALYTQEIDFVNQSNGNAWIRADERLSIKHQANGFVHYYGNGRLKDVKQFGNGEVMHRKDSED